MVLCSLKAVNFDILEKSIFEEFECGNYIHVPNVTMKEEKFGYPVTDLVINL